MSLPWVPLYLDAYIGNTMHLTCEEHGAYLQLMLAYYRTENSLPASDRSLSAIVKLPMDRWLEAKPTLAAFFREDGNRWHHDRIDSEIFERSAKHAQSIAQAQAASAARWGKKSSRNAAASTPAMLPASSEHTASIKTTTSNAPSMPPASVEQSVAIPHLHLHLDSLSTADADSDPGEEVEESAPAAIGTPVDPGFTPCANHLATCKLDGADDETVKQQVMMFIAHWQESGGFSSDWDASWFKWWQRWRAYRDAQAAKAAKTTKPKAPPRVEVTATVDWDAHAERWSRSQGWPRGVGGDPQSASCRCPPEILEKHGIDPRTGEKLKTPAPEKV